MDPYRPVLIAHGVNQVVWHGMPYNPPGGSNVFFATTHVGPESPFAADLLRFNAYLTDACARMRRGRTYANLAVYLPIEDRWMVDLLPRSLRTPGAHSYWELRHEVVPEEAEPFHPLWVSGSFLHDAAWDGSRLRVGGVEFAALLICSRWLDARALAAILRLAEAGLPVAVTRRPEKPGRSEDDGYTDQINRLFALPNVHGDVAELTLTPLVAAEKLPPYWARVDGEDLILFFAHPGAWDVRYPMEPGQALTLAATKLAVVVHWGGVEHPVTLDFAPGGSACLQIRQGRVEIITLRGGSAWPG